MAPEHWYASPVIIVGAGRSGTSLVAGLLDAHPDCYMIGETLFLEQKLLATVFEAPETFHRRRLGAAVQMSSAEWAGLTWSEFWACRMKRSFATAGAAVEAAREAEDDRIGRVLGRTFAELAIPPAARKTHWGFKAIWNGCPTFPYSWDLYERAFPAARYVHSVRHPLRFLESYFALNGMVPTRRRVLHAAAMWVLIIRHTRLLAGTGRYLEYRLEDLAGDGGATLGRLFDFLGLALAPSCREAMGRRFGPAASGHPTLSLTAADVERVPGLGPLMAELGYRLDGTVAAMPVPSVPEPAAEPEAQPPCHHTSRIRTRLKIGETVVLPPRPGGMTLAWLPTRRSMAVSLGGVAVLLAGGEALAYHQIGVVVPRGIVLDEQLLTMLAGWGVLALGTGRAFVRLSRTAFARELVGRERLMRELGTGATLLLAGILLMAPGVITDAVGAVLLVPGVRKAGGGVLARVIAFALRAPGDA